MHTLTVTTVGARPPMRLIATLWAKEKPVVRCSGGYRLLMATGSTPGGGGEGVCVMLPETASAPAAAPKHAPLSAPSQLCVRIVQA